VATADPFPAPDPLGDALHLLQLSGAFYCRSELTEPWGLGIPAIAGCLWFHVVHVGGGWLEVEGSEARWLRPGDLTLVPHGVGHVLRSAPGVPAPDVVGLPQTYETDRYSVLRYGGGGQPTSLVCGAVRFDDPAARSMVDLLPPVLAVDGSDPQQPEWLASVLRLIANEARAIRPGGETVMTRLSDVLVIQAIRSWLENDPAARTGWLGALRDRQIGHALALVHRDPGQPWSVASLASASAMSRSAFAARFTALVGEPAMSYVTRRRMYTARRALEEEDISVSAVAGRLGYSSEAAFSRAFTRHLGETPGAVRRAAHA
jgi:AraC-like DNA-binding protein